jgi:hypothetical protein
MTEREELAKALHHTEVDREYAADLLGDLDIKAVGPQLEIATQWFCKARIETTLAVVHAAPAVTDEMVDAATPVYCKADPRTTTKETVRAILTAALAAKSSPAPLSALNPRGESEPSVMPAYGAGETIDPESGEYLPPGHDGTDPKDYV